MSPASSVSQAATLSSGGSPVTGLVGYWNFDEGAGNQASDSSGNSNDADLVNGPQWTTGKVGGALSFDGIDDYVNAGADASLNNLTAKTVAAWINTNTSGIDHIMANKGWEFGIDNSNVLSYWHRWSYGDWRGGLWQGTTPIGAGQWLHVTVVYDASSPANAPLFYINGVQEIPTEVSPGHAGSPTDDSGINLAIGSTYDFFDGQIDEFHIYDRALTSAEVLALYTTTTPSNSSPVLDAIGDITVSEGAIVTFIPTATDTDNDTLSFSYSGWMTSSSYTTQTGDAGTYTVTVTVSDGNGGSDSQSVTVTVRAATPSDTTPPVRSAGNPTGTLAAGTVSTTLSLTTDETATCRYATTPGTAYGAMGSGFAASGSTAHSTTLSGLADGAAYTYYVRCQDSAGNANTSDYAIAYSVASGSVNHAPVLDPIADLRVTEGETVTFNPSATDVDLDTLSFSYAGWMTSSSYTTQPGDAGTHTVTVSVADGNGGTDSQDVSVTVSAAPDTTAPTVPQNLIATSQSISRIDLSWNPSSDDTGVAGYRIYRDGVEVAMSVTTNYSDTSLPSDTTYGYQVSAFDSAGNESPLSATVQATTQSSNVAGLIGYWNFDEGTGSLASDSSGNNNDANLINGPQWTTGRIGGALSFDGVDDYADTGAGAVLNNITSKTLVAWIRRDTTSATSQVIASKGWEFNIDDTGVLGYWHRWSSGSWGGGLWEGSTPINVGQWYQVAVVYDASSQSNDPIFYINGVQEIPTEVSHGHSGSSVDDSAIHLAIGSTYDFFDGQIDDFRVYDRVLTSAEVLALYNSAASPSNTPPVLDAIADITVTEGETVVFNPTATDTDLDSLTFSYSGWMTSNSYTTTAGDAGTHVVAVTVSDGNGGIDSQNVTVTVNSNGSSGNSIVLNSATTYQTMKGWESTSWIDQYDDDDSTRYFIDNAHRWSAASVDLAANTFGINRIRLEIHAGQENPIGYFALYQNNQGTRSQWRSQVYNIINDNDDPFTINPAGFQYAKLDRAIDLVVKPLKNRVEANGEKLYVNLTYVDNGTSAFEHTSDPEEYAEFILAAFQHIDTKYGFTPDAVNIILEPDHMGKTSGWNSGTLIGRAMVAAGRRLESYGYTPDFIAPSTTSMATTPGYIDEIMQVTDADKYIKEIAYHRYGGRTAANLQAIANRGATYGLETAMLEWWDPPNNFNVLHDDIKNGNNSSWQNGAIAKVQAGQNKLYLANVDSSNPTNPVVSANPSAQYIRQYFKYIRSGAVRIAATSSNAQFDPLAFINTNRNYVVVVKATAGGSFSIDNLPAGTYGVNYTTGSDSNTPSAYDVNNADQTITTGQTLTTHIPAAGVITVYKK